MKVIKLKEQSTKAVINQAVTCLEDGGLVIYPTETVYGAGVDATNQEAVNKLLAYKSRREGKPLSVAVANTKMASKYVELNEQAQTLHDKFLPGPYTIISKDKGQLAQGVASEFNTVGIRIPDHQLILELAKKLCRPITSTSANASGKKRPYTIKDILDNISHQQQQKIDLIIDAGKLPANEPSTVIDTTLSTPLTVRGGDHNQGQKTLEFISHSDQETMELAGKLMLKNWNQLKKQGLVIGLSGQLGAGKTIFAKGIGKFLQITQTITSPTYTYIKEYGYHRHQTSGTFYHIDTWKVDSQQGVETLEIESLIKPKNIVAIEWWTQVKQYLPKIKPDLIVDLQVKADSVRQITLYEK